MGIYFATDIDRINNEYMYKVQTIWRKIVIG